MKRINLFILPMLFGLLLCSSCAGGIAVVLLNVDVCIKKDTLSSFTADELKHLRITVSGGDTDNFVPDGAPIGSAIQDENGNYYRRITYYLGSGRTEWKLNKLGASYKSKMQTFSFTIEDTSGVYETFTMNPLDDSYRVIDESIPLIKYTVTLKKK